MNKTVINYLNLDEVRLIAACKRDDRSAQRLLYDRFAPAMLGLCTRYVGTSDAEDVLVDAFFKVFDNLDSYKNEGSFAGWIRRIVVNEALMHLRKRKRRPNTDEITASLPVKDTRYSAEDLLQAEDIMELMEQLPEGYRTVFNLYVIEGYKHREIAELLGISINTSKSQLILARKRMRELLASIGYPVYEFVEKMP